MPLKSIGGAIPVEFITEVWESETKEVAAKKTKEVQRNRVKTNKDSKCMGCINLAYPKGSFRI